MYTSLKEISFSFIISSSSSFRVKLFKIIDYLLGPFVLLACYIFKPKIQDINFSNVNTILIIRPGGIGDALWLLPHIKYLKDQKPELMIDILCEKRNYQVFEFLRSCIRKIICYDKNIQQIVALKNQYDLAIDTEQFHFFSAFFAFIAAPITIGFEGRSIRNMIYTVSLPYDHQKKECDLFSNLFEVIQKPFLIVPDTLNFRPDDLMWAKDLIGGKQTVVLFLGASVRERSWGEVKFEELTKALLNKEIQVILVGGKDDQNVASYIQGKNPNVLNFVGKISLAQSAALIHYANLIIGADSGIMHLSVFTNVPAAIWLFGAGIQKKWFPQLPHHEVINLNFQCSPCTIYGYTPKCPYTVKCLRDISTQMVLERALHYV